MQIRVFIANPNVGYGAMTILDVFLRLDFLYNFIQKRAIIILIAILTFLFQKVP